MRSKTSFFNGTVLKKDITRYAPIWGIYTIFLLLTLFAMAEYETVVLADNLLELIRAMPWVNLLYTGICAAFLFADLFNGRLCNATHAFPLRREGWLCTHLLSGFLFSFVPNLLVSLLAIPLLQEYAYVAPIWLAGITLQNLFFFGSAVLCAVCAGNFIGMAALYGIFHLIAVLIGGVAELFYQPLLYGVEMNVDTFMQFAPVSQLGSMQYVDFEIFYETAERYGIFHGFIGKSWLHLGLCAGTGVICIVLSWLVCKKRQLESAGDLLALKKLSPLFSLICTVGAGAVLYLISESFNGRSYVFLAVGALVGYFVGRMLLGRTVKVFTKRAWLGFGVIVVALTGTMLLTWLDPLGVTRYVPNLDKIESAAVIGADKGRDFYPTSSNAYSIAEDDSIRFRITGDEELTKLQDFHEKLIQYRPDADLEYRPSAKVTISYTLKSGRVVSRYYRVAPDTEVGKLARDYFNDIRYIFNVNDSQILHDLFGHVVFEGYTEDRSYYNIKLETRNEISGLINAIQKDCRDGKMAQNWVFHDKTDKESFYLYFYIENKAMQDIVGRSSVHVQVWDDSSYTMRYLKELLARRTEE